jgi:short-subunit dehydrogenase
MDLTGQVAVITGGTSGIGEQLAKDLRTRGARVVVCGLTSASFEQDGIDVKICDVRNDVQVQEFFAGVLARFGAIDILINNAGAAVYRAFEESSVEEVMDILNVNLGGPYRCAKAVLPTMIRQKRGLIVNIASIGGELIITPNAAYCGAKHGLVAWTKAVRHELGRFNIGVMAVCPDHVPTQFQDHPTFRRRDRYRRQKARLTVSAVSSAILRAMKYNRPVTYIPHWLGVVVWASQAFAWLFQPVWRRIIAKRMTELYSEIAAEERTAADSAAAFAAAPRERSFTPK